MGDARRMHAAADAEAGDMIGWVDSPNHVERLRRLREWRKRMGAVSIEYRERIESLGAAIRARRAAIAGMTAAIAELRAERDAKLAELAKGKPAR